MESDNCVWFLHIAVDIFAIHLNLHISGALQGFAKSKKDQ